MADAARVHATAIRLDPQFAPAHANLADALLAQGKLAEAFAACERALALAPQLAEAHGIRGQVLQRQGRHSDAFAAYRQALALKPGLVTLHTEVGNLLREQGRLDEAITAHKRTIALKPDCAEAWGHLGVSLQTLGQWQEAEEAYREATRLAPDYVETYSNLGVLLQLMGKPEDAVAALRTAIQLNPRYANAHHNLGGALKELGRHGEAIQAYRQALACNPDLSLARFQLCDLRMSTCDWRGLAQETADCLAALRRERIRVSPFSVLAMSDDPAVHLEHTRLWADGLTTAPPVVRHQGGAVATPEGRRIRIGYLSSDFFRHATGSLITELLERHDRRRFEIVGYCHSPDDGSDMRKRLIAAFDRFVDVGALSFVEAAQRIRDDQLDILVDLKGYTRNARIEIMAHRPAPVQVSYLGYPGSMGAAFIDYIIADAFVAPAHAQAHFTERMVRLPDSYQPNDRNRCVDERPLSRSECGLPDDGFVFCSFNGSYKITEPVFSIWMRLLGAVPGSVLWLLDGGDLAKSNLRREAAARGIDPRRLVFAPRQRMERHIARQRLADLFLDTLPVNAHTTASEALWAGLPVLTCAGQTFIGRVAGSLLHAIGLPELVTSTLAEYEALALRLAENPGMLRDLRDRLARNRLTAPLFDTERYTRHLELAYTHMVRLCAAGREPEAFSVSDLLASP
jgi:predicted O-linked N-acetylglucosamine transferase (SPINDLY family)